MMAVFINFSVLVVMEFSLTSCAWRQFKIPSVELSLGTSC